MISFMKLSDLFFSFEIPLSVQYLIFSMVCLSNHQDPLHSSKNLTGLFFYYASHWIYLWNLLAPYHNWILLFLLSFICHFVSNFLSGGFAYKLRYFLLIDLWCFLMQLQITFIRIGSSYKSSISNIEVTEQFFCYIRQGLHWVILWN